MAETTFRAEVRPSGRGSGHLVEVPARVIEKLGGGGRIPVTVTFDSVPYRGSIVRMGGTSVLGITKAVMAEAGVSAGTRVTVVARNDDGPRTVDVPPELSAELRKDLLARTTFDALSYSHRREHAGYIAEAKRPETRVRRAERTIAMLREQATAKEH